MKWCAADGPIENFSFRKHSHLVARWYDPSFKRGEDFYDNLDESGAREIVTRVGSIFVWSPDVLLGSGTVDPVQLGGATARFKMPKGRDARSALVYTAYAYRLATICARASGKDEALLLASVTQAPRSMVLPSEETVAV